MSVVSLVPGVSGVPSFSGVPSVFVLPSRPSVSVAGMAANEAYKAYVANEATYQNWARTSFS